MVRTDDLGNGYKIIQDTDSFCFGTDSVLLSDFANIKTGQNVVDLCSGNGIIPILLCAKTNAKHISGVEIQKSSYDLSVRNTELNNLENRIKFINDDVKNALKYFDYNSIDVVTCNPPYMINGSGFRNDNDAKTIARHEVLITINDICNITSKLLKFGGKMFMVHRCDRMADVIHAMKSNSIEPKRIQMIHPYVGEAPNLFLVEGLAGGNPSVKFEKPIYMYKG